MIVFSKHPIKIMFQNSWSLFEDALSQETPNSICQSGHPYWRYEQSLGLRPMDIPYSYCEITEPPLFGIVYSAQSYQEHEGDPAAALDAII